ncbi:hypothetical protein CATRI_12035 [Corynebacterium atrinae]|uniref:helix-turn-helix domain-containing protein n=1 Tax=Corynebacterium atrinae TaxID=1336740 RepID=UPI0025B43F4B|nr:PucR family transcriptional regulator [Corynebacterium atrinae]WJY64456.1 hypothetical protein CATRI_12035 [Corynebacterium atrinae]
MRDLTIWLDSLDPEAGAALRVISYFEELLAQEVGVHAIARAAAKLTGCGVGISYADQQTQIRVTADGIPTMGTSFDPEWLSTSLDVVVGTIWIERDGPPQPLDPLVLERAAGAVNHILSRKRVSANARKDADAWCELAIDAGVALEDRRHAVKQLGLNPQRLRPIVLTGGQVKIVEESTTQSFISRQGRKRVAIGYTAPVEELPESALAAQLAFRLTADGTELDPGPRVVFAESAGGFLVLAQTLGPESPRHPDVNALEVAGREVPWMIQTLDTFSIATSVRAAADLLRVHHSTLQERLLRAERLLGWNIRDTEGRMRLHLALVMRRLHRQ